MATAAAAAASDTPGTVPTTISPPNTSALDAVTDKSAGHITENVSSQLTAPTLTFGSLNEPRPGAPEDRRTYQFQRMIRLALLSDNTDPAAPNKYNPFKDEMLLSVKDNDFQEINFKDQKAMYEPHLDHYFEHVHELLPHLVERDVRISFSNLLHESVAQTQAGIQTLLVLAIGALLPSSMHLCDTYQSSRLFLNAFREFCKWKHEETLETARTLILFTFYSLLHPCGGNSWHLRGLLMRICITLGLHHESSLQRICGRGEEVIQQSRIVFWCSYMLDR
jgi:hypothetical protein